MISCSRDQEIAIPKGVLSKEKMTEIMTDIHIVEGAKIGRNVMGDTLQVDVYFNKVYQKHHTTQEEFTNSYSFYTKHPGTLDEIYEQVIENINSLEVVTPKWEGDSISGE